VSRTDATTTTGAAPAHSPAHVAGIDALRALAVLAVIAYHLNPDLLPGGFVGVDIFFTISGFVITKSLIERRATSVWAFFTGFYRRRFVRIAPALFVFLGFTAVASALFIPKSFMSQGIFDTAKWAIYGLSNVSLVMGNDGYFGDRAEFNPFLHTWSLGVEEQFYLVFPLIAILIAWGIHRQKLALRNAGILVLVGTTLVSFGISVWQTQNDAVNAFYMLPARFWELAVGALLYLFLSRRAVQRPSRRLYTSVFALGATTVTVSLIWATTDAFPFWWAVPAVLGTALLIHAAYTHDGNYGPLGRVLTAPAVLFIGKISFSLYLWHWGFFVLFRWTVGLDSLWKQAFALALTFLCAWLSFRFVETPFRTGSFVRRRADLTVIALGTALALLLTAGVTVANARAVTVAKRLNDPAFNDSQAIAAKLQTIPVDDYGTGHTLYFVGDSHAGHYKNLARWVADKTGSDFDMIRHYGCGFVNLSGPAAETCPGDGEFIHEITATAEPGDIVVLSSFSTGRISGLMGPTDKTQLLEQVNSAESESRRAEVLRSSIGVVEELQAEGLIVVLAAPTPVFETATDRCLQWFNQLNPVCASGFSTDRPYQDAFRAPVMESYVTLAETTGATLWDPFPILCPDSDMCYSKQGDVYTYIDQHHLSANGNLVLLDSFLALAHDLWFVPLPD
jgi:peptidoglycan/LPS O-acetylase OafA/YrhL